MPKDDDYEKGLQNFYDGDRSLWSKLEKTHRGCGGTVWIRTVDLERDIPVGYKAGACEKCLGSGTMDALLELDELY